MTLLPEDDVTDKHYQIYESLGSVDGVGENGEVSIAIGIRRCIELAIDGLADPLQLNIWEAQSLGLELSQAVIRAKQTFAEPHAND
jgi:hypothetical protein